MKLLSNPLLKRLEQAGLDIINLEEETKKKKKKGTESMVDGFAFEREREI